MSRGPLVLTWLAGGFVIAEVAGKREKLCRLWCSTCSLSRASVHGVVVGKETTDPAQVLCVRPCCGSGHGDVERGFETTSHRTTRMKHVREATVEDEHTT